VWLIIRLNQLPVIALVSRYLTNELIGREPIWKRELREKTPPLVVPTLEETTFIGY
jgi:hypothetical protein